mmetsp:Transcript_44145/g.116829  ORF Transcript_44145/g.116829 Transcript_44145/m.116829 type:complete len:229 (+) Transcript_44145:427-1113(+)
MVATRAIHGVAATVLCDRRVACRASPDMQPTSCPLKLTPRQTALRSLLEVELWHVHCRRSDSRQGRGRRRRLDLWVEAAGRTPALQPPKSIGPRKSRAQCREQYHHLVVRQLSPAGRAPSGPANSELGLEVRLQAMPAERVPAPRHVEGRTFAVRVCAQADAAIDLGGCVGANGHFCRLCVTALLPPLLEVSLQGVHSRSRSLRRRGRVHRSRCRRGCHRSQGLCSSG